MAPRAMLSLLCMTAGSGSQGPGTADAILDPRGKPPRAKIERAQQLGLQVCTLSFQPLQELDWYTTRDRNLQAEIAQAACPFHPHMLCCQRHLAA